MAVKSTLNQNLTDQQRLDRLAKLCEELQAAVDQAGDHRRLAEEMKGDRAGAPVGSGVKPVKVRKEASEHGRLTKVHTHPNTCNSTRLESVS